jgi:glutamine amidotransferase
MRVGVIDYGVGNLGSVQRAIEELRATPVLVNRPTDLHLNDCLILPGVGSFGDCTKILNSGGWIDAIQTEVLTYNRPLLGICLGMQLLADSSSEGAGSLDNRPRGLGLIPGTVEHIRTIGTTLRVPHIGWNSISFCGERDSLFSEIPEGTDFYFVHSYGFIPQSAADVIASVNYGVDITAAVRRGHVWGTQFHPEKSSKAGFKLLQNFLERPTC